MAPLPSSAPIGAVAAASFRVHAPWRLVACSTLPRLSSPATGLCRSTQASNAHGPPRGVVVRSLATAASDHAGVNGCKHFVRRPMVESVTCPGTLGGVRKVTIGKNSKRQYRYDDIVKLISKPSPNRMLIDVRTANEITATGRIPGAQNVAITAHPHAFHLPPDEFEDAFGFRLPEDRDKDELVFYCKAGVRSDAAAGLALEAGWKKVGSYGGSWIDWESQGGEVEGASKAGVTGHKSSA